MSRGSRCARLSRCHRGCCHIGRVGFGRFRVRIIHILTLFLDPSVVNVARCGRAHLKNAIKLNSHKKQKDSKPLMSRPSRCQVTHTTSSSSYLYRYFSIGWWSVQSVHSSSSECRDAIWDFPFAAALLFDQNHFLTRDSIPNQTIETFVFDYDHLHFDCRQAIRDSLDVDSRNHRLAHVVAAFPMHPHLDPAESNTD